MIQTRSQTQPGHSPMRLEASLKEKMGTEMRGEEESLGFLT